MDNRKEVNEMANEKQASVNNLLAVLAMQQAAQKEDLKRTGALIKAKRAELVKIKAASAKKAKVKKVTKTKAARKSRKATKK